MLQKETLEAKLSAVKTEFAQLQALNPDINYYEHYPLAGPSKKNRNSYSYNSLPQVKSAGGPVAEDADGRNRQRSFRRLFKSLNKKERNPFKTSLNNKDRNPNVLKVPQTKKQPFKRIPY